MSASGTPRAIRREERETQLSRSLEPRASGRRAFLWTSAAACAALALGCARTGGGSRQRVVAYISVDDAVARSALEACRAATGVEVDAVFDTEATKTTGLENRLRAERNRPRADLFWSSEAFATSRLAQEGVLASLPPAFASVLAGWPTAWRDAGDRWFGFAARARVVVTRADAPAGQPPIHFWSDLASPVVARALAEMGRPRPIAIADPRFGTTRGHLAALADAWSRARASGAREVPTLGEWIDGLRDAGVRVLPGGNAATVEAVASGECAYGLTDTDDALVAIARGLPIAMHLPRTLPEGMPGGGTMLVPNTVGVVAGREMREPVLAVLRWLASPSCEALLCASASRNLPIGPQATVGSCDPGFAERDPMAFDLDAVAPTASEVASVAHAQLTRGGA